MKKEKPEFFMRFYGPGCDDRACNVIYYAFHVRGHVFETQAREMEVSINPLLPAHWDKRQIAFIFETEEARDAFKADKEVLGFYQTQAAPADVEGQVELRNPGDAAFAMA